MNNSIFQVLKSYQNYFWFAVILFSVILGVGESAAQCHIGLKMFSVESGNAICAPMSSQRCIESCEWNTTCTLTSHYKAFRGRRTYVSGIVLTDTSFLLQCCASFATIIEMNAKQEPTCVWVSPAETVPNEGSIRFDPPLATNEYIRDILAERKANGRVKIKAQICKFITQIIGCQKSEMNAEEIRFYTKLQQRLTKIKNLLHLPSDRPEKSPDALEKELSFTSSLNKDIPLQTQAMFPSLSDQLIEENHVSKILSEKDFINTNSPVSIFDSFQISTPIIEDSSNSKAIIEFGSDSLTINHEETPQKTNIEPKIFGPTIKNHKAAISPRIHVKRIQPRIYDSSIENTELITESSTNGPINSIISSQRAKDAVEDWTNEIAPRRKSWSRKIRNSSSYSGLVPFRNKQYNQVRIPVNEFWNNDRNGLYKQARKSAIMAEELAIKNELQIQKIQRDQGILPQFAQAPIIAQNLDDFPQITASNPFTRLQNPQPNINYNHAFAKAPKFKIIPLAEHKYTNAQTKVIQRPTATYAQHQQRQYQIQKQQEFEQMQTMRKAWAEAQKSQQNREKYFNLQDLSQPELQMQENLKIFHKLRSAVKPDAERSTSAGSTAALSGLLSCCQQQAPGCKHLCSKDVSQHEIKHALTTNQCAPLSMTTVIQCFPRYYNISAVTQCCHANAHATKPTNAFDATTLNNPFKSAAPPAQRLPEQCLSLCAPNFKLSFAHFACIDHISTIVECYRDLLN